MPKRLDTTVDDRIVSLRRAHKTEAQIATILRREGVEITASGVHRVLGRLGLAAPRKAPKDSVPPASPKSAPQVTDAPDEGNVDDAPERLRRTLASLERVAAQAEEDRDVARVVAAQRAITQATGLLAKMTPPPPIDPDARPDMVAAAKRGRERMHTLLGRLLDEAKRC